MSATPGAIQPAKPTPGTPTVEPRKGDQDRQENARTAAERKERKGGTAFDSASGGGGQARHFLLRRLHSLTGVMPVGVFVIFHLFTNAQMAAAPLIGEDFFQHEVEFIHSMPALVFLEIFGLWLPIGFHAALGVWYTFSGRSNVHRYGWADNWRYTVQRVTGMLALVFIVLHIATLRWGWNIFGWYTPFYVDAVATGGQVIAVEPSGEPLSLASASVAIAFQGGAEGSVLAGALVTILYLVGVLSVVFHWSNGLWTAAITWGLTTSVASMRRWGYVCAGLGVALTLFSLAAIWGSLAYELTPEEAAAWEILAERNTPAAEAQPGPDEGHNPTIQPRMDD